MPRARVEEDYEAKKRSILDTAARLFARVGYANAKMQDIAAKCGASKSMLYHYFPKKEDLLFEMLKEHLETLIESFAGIASQYQGVDEKFGAFVGEYILKSGEARTRHVVAMYDVRFLPKRQRSVILELERRLLAVVSDLLVTINPNLPEHVYKPYSLLVFGMLNWTDIWYKPTGEIPPGEICDRISRLFLHGFLQERS